MTNKYLLLIIALLSLPFFAHGQTGRTTVTLTAPVVTVASYTDKEVVLNGKTELHLTTKATVASGLLKNSVVKLNTADSWIVFDNVRPQFVIDSLLRYIYVFICYSI